MDDAITPSAWAFLDQAHDAIPWDAIRTLADEAVTSAELRTRLLALALPDDNEWDRQDDLPAGANPWLLAGAALLLTGPRLADDDRRALARQVLSGFMELDEPTDFDHEFVDHCVGALGPVVLPDVLRALQLEDEFDHESFLAMTLRSLLAMAGETPDPALREPVIAKCMSDLQQVADDHEGKHYDPPLYFNTAWALAKMRHEPARPLLTALAQRQYPGIVGENTAAEFQDALRSFDGQDDTGDEPSKLSNEQWINRWWDHALRHEEEDLDEPAWDDDLDEAWDDDADDVGLDADDLSAPLPDPLRDPLGWAPLDPYRRPEPKTGRNDPCPCGSGKKYKKCCGKNA